MGRKAILPPSWVAFEVSRSKAIKNYKEAVAKSFNKYKKAVYLARVISDKAEVEEESRRMGSLPTRQLKPSGGCR